MIIAAEGRPLKLLKQEFSNLCFITLSGYNLSYSGKRSMGFQILTRTPKIFWGIYKEHKALKSIIKEYNIDVVISDNRYGMWSKRVPSILITHQIIIKCPKKLYFLEPILRNITGFFIRKYNECWVPDYESGNNLSGDLSHQHIHQNMRYIGPLSRFSGKNISSSNQYDLMVSLSGPEPQRTIFEQLIVSQLKQKKLKTIILNGTLDDDNKKTHHNVTIFSHLETKEMESAMFNSKYILSRPGYSTIMDLAVTGNKAIFVPTPGQTEQEYLAKRLESKGLFYQENQNEFNLERAIKCASNYSGFQKIKKTDLLKMAVDDLLKGN